MKQALVNALETICPGNVFLQGTLAEDGSYPESFITFWTNYTENNQHFDDDTFAVDWHFSVMFYATDPALVNSAPALISAALKNAGFIPQGKGNDIPCDVPTHTGWVIDFIKTEIL